MHLASLKVAPIDGVATCSEGLAKCFHCVT